MEPSRSTLRGNPPTHVYGVTESAVQMFWPWREDQLTHVFCSAPRARFEVEAWDVYQDGKYLYTEYNVDGYVTTHNRTNDRQSPETAGYAPFRGFFLLFLKSDEEERL